MILLAHLVVFTFIAFISPQIFRGIKVRGVAAAAGVAIIFGFLNLLIGWALKTVLTLVSLPLTCLTFGAFQIVVVTVVNAILLKLVDVIIEPFEIKGWWPAFGMGLLFAVGGWLVHALST